MSDQPPAFPGPPPGSWPPAGQYPPAQYPPAAQYPPPGPYGPPGQYGPPGWPGAAPAGPPPKRGKGGLVIGLVVGLLVLALIAAAAIVFVNRDSGHRSGDSATPIFTAGTPSTLAGSPTSGGAAPVTPPPVPPGYKLVQNQERGFAFLIPTTWNTTDLTGAQLDQLIARLRTSNPQLAASLEQYKAAIGSGGLAFAYGPPEGTFTPSVNLLKVSITGISPEQLAGQMELSLGAVNGKVVSKTNVVVGGNQGVQIQVQLTLDAAGGQPRIVNETVLALASPTATYVLTMGGGDPATIKTVLASLRVR